jgi:methylated-DNA-[protein]-cysteine S-methyltransferase
MKTLNALRTESPLGNITLETSQESLCGAWFDDQKHGPSEAEQSRWHPSLLAPIEF